VHVLQVLLRQRVTITYEDVPPLLQLPAKIKSLYSFLYTPEALR